MRGTGFWINLAHRAEQISMVILGWTGKCTNDYSWNFSFYKLPEMISIIIKSCWWTRHENPSIAIFRGIGGINLASFVPSICNWHGWAGPREKVTQSCNWNCWIRQKNNIRIKQSQSTYAQYHDTRWRAFTDGNSSTSGSFSVSFTKPRPCFGYLLIMLTACTTKCKCSLPHGSWFCLKNLKPKH